MKYQFHNVKGENKFRISVYNDNISNPNHNVKQSCESDFPFEDVLNLILES